MLIKERINLGLAILMLFMHFTLPFAAQAAEIPEAEPDPHSNSEAVPYGPEGRFFVPEEEHEKEEKEDEFLHHLPPHTETAENEHDVEEQVELYFDILSLDQHLKFNGRLIEMQAAHLAALLQENEGYGEVSLGLVSPKIFAPQSSINILQPAKY